MGNVTTSRRGLIGAIAATSIAVPVAAATVPTIDISGTPFGAALDRYRSAKAAEDQFDDTYMAPAVKALSALEDRIPHVSVQIFGRTFSTRDVGAVLRCRDYVDHPTPDLLRSDSYGLAKQFVEAAEARWARIEAAPETAQYNAHEARSDALLEVRCATRAALLATPATSAADLLVKLDLIEEDELDFSKEIMAAFRSDLVRLAGGLG
jgi:hypothetical protein